MNTFTKITSSIATTIALMAGVSAPAELKLAGLSPAEQGLAIAKERKIRDLGWEDSVSTVTMTLRNAQGEESLREMRMKSLEVADDGDKGLTIFDTPKDVKGTAFLNFSHIFFLNIIKM